MALFSILTGRFPLVMKTLCGQQPVAQTTFQRLFNVSAVDLAARKGTRDRKAKKKVKVEVKKLSFSEKRDLTLKRASARNNVDRHIDDESKPALPDGVIVHNTIFFKEFRHPVIEAIEQFRKIHHPTVLNEPEATVNLYIELNSRGIKSTRYVSPFQRTVLIPHGFQVNQDRTVLVFTKDPEIQKRVVESGATHAGGTELIKAIQNGSLKVFEYEFVLSDYSMMTELVPLRGLMKKKFPSEKSGTLVRDVLGIVHKFLTGVQYRSQRDEFQKNFSSITCPIGNLKMTSQQLEENAIEVLKDVDGMRPKRSGKFITKCFVTSPPSERTVRINPFLYIEEEMSKKDSFDSDDEEEAVAA